ncbi:MAG: SpoIIE family protein phosphatase [Phycisphaerae bacterium]
MVPEPQQPRLTDFMDLQTLQEIQDVFSVIADVQATVTDADGNTLTQPHPTDRFLKRSAEIERQQTEATAKGSTSYEYVAPIVVGGQKLGLLKMTAGRDRLHLDEAKLTALAGRFSMEIPELRRLARSLVRQRNTRPAAVQLFYMLANAVARLCFQEYQLRQRVNELTAVYNVTMMLAGTHDLSTLLERTVQLVTEVMGVKAASIRLLDEEEDALVMQVVHNLSDSYLAKGPVRMSRSEIDRVALSDKGYEWVQDMREDDRVQAREKVIAEGLVSMVSAGMRYQGKSVGVLRVYTDKPKTFTANEIDMLKAIAAQAAVGIENARLIEGRLETRALERQIEQAADVQQRMMPAEPPKLAGFDFATAYLPRYDLGGDFYDFIPLANNNLGLAVGDVSGKGLPASLIMASARAALRAQVDNVYYIYEAIRRLNVMLCRDTKPEEFVTLFYGVLDGNTRRLTYVSAGHPPGLLLRDGQIEELESPNMILGVDESEGYTQDILDLKPGDVLLLYSDGAMDAANFAGDMYGSARLAEALKHAVTLGTTAEVICDHLLWDLRRFVGMSNRTDDITMIVLRAG